MYIRVCHRGGFFRELNLDNEIPWPKDLKPPNMPSFVVKNSNSWGCCDLFPSAKNLARDTSATYKTCSQSPCISRTKRLMNKNEALFERSRRDGLEIYIVYKVPDK